MIPEGELFEDYLRRTLFLQKVVDFSHHTHLGQLFERSSHREADALLAHDILWRHNDDVVADCFRRFRQPRVIVTEVLRDRGLQRYTELATAAGYRLHRCTFIRSPGDDIAAMEFHRKD